MREEAVDPELVEDDDATPPPTTPTPATTTTSALDDHGDDVIGLDALRQLRRRRRRSRLETVHWIDALYRAYLTGLLSVAAVVVVSGWFPDEPLDAAGVEDLVAHGPGWLGLAAAVAVAMGLRSGSRGGPLTLEPATVHHELLAPLDRGAVLRGPALKQLRFLLFGGAAVGGVLGVLASHRLPANATALAVSAAATAALAVALAHGLALTASGRHLPRWAGTALALVLIAWSVGDALAGTTTSPLTLLGSVALWPVEAAPAGLVVAPLAAAAVAAGIASLPGTSIEAARRRAGLVSQLRFAVTLQDVRTVVLLRRQLSQERPRPRPWLRLRRGGRIPPVAQRDLRSVLRYPVVRIARMLALGAVAGLAMGAVWRGTAPMVILAGLALYLAGYDAVEPLAQEVDHPSRWDALAGQPGSVLLAHLPVALLTMALVSGAAVAASLVLVPASVVVDVAVVLILPVTAAAVIGAAISTALGSADMASLNMMGSEVMGMVLVARMVVPPALVVASLVPALLVGHDPAALQLDRASNASTWTLLALVAGGLWLRSRRPVPAVGGLMATAQKEQELQRTLRAEAKAEQQAARAEEKAERRAGREAREG